LSSASSRRNTRKGENLVVKKVDVGLSAKALKQNKSFGAGGPIVFGTTEENHVSSFPFLHQVRLKWADGIGRKTAFPKRANVKFCEIDYVGMTFRELLLDLFSQESGKPESQATLPG
jgi:hypothetical protein